ncbi:hypothetical protein F5887DRAFT_1080856 [Amanita rubescens]|nr:hypothetical protein F5887DRAFT_1080856 [Amanita rubescens]
MLASTLGTLKAYVANNEGLLFVIAAEGFFALMNLSVKILGEDVSVLEIMWIRMIITCLCAVAYMHFAKINDPVLGPPGIRILLCLRGFTGFFGIFGLWFSLQYLSLSDAIVFVTSLRQATQHKTQSLYSYC